MADRLTDAHAASGATAKLELRAIHHEFKDDAGQPLPVLDGLDLVAEENQFVAVVGPTGSGKSTLFHILAGLLAPTSGGVYVDGRDITGSTGHVAYMMQKDLLLGWRRVIDNIALGPELAGEPRAAARERAREMMPMFGLGGFEDFYPAGLSGGMRQRVALMRTFLCEKSLLLLDEPFSAVDALTRAGLHEWLQGVCADFPRTVLFITHDPEEAVLLSDRTYVLTRRPAHVKGVVDVDLPRPRTHETVGDPHFAELKRQVLDLVWEERAEAVR
ncbi:MAG TPA: ABC transporter ATP-binding protein [Solirubrobacteraceae bacterium]|nr:ABC transporter ATP-binding protein [Solirubrobacteraceae bacterium]